MRSLITLAAAPLTALLALPAPADAQQGERELRERSVESRRAPGAAHREVDARPRAVLGVTTGPSGSRRDTLGLLVTRVVPNGPAERAGIEEGNRLVAINGVSLRVPAADAEDYAAVNVVGRRLTRELRKLNPGDQVELRVYGGGQTRTVRLRTAAADSIYRPVRARLAAAEDRASLGIGIGTTGSVRDSLGVLVMSVVDSGPAARAGLEEGNRIAAINGVDLRARREDAEDGFAGHAQVRRLHRQLEQLKPGQEVELRVYANGQFRTVRVQTVRASELPRQLVNTFIFRGPGGHAMPAMPSGPAMPMMRFHLDGDQIELHAPGHMPMAPHMPRLHPREMQIERPLRPGAPRRAPRHSGAWQQA